MKTKVTLTIALVALSFGVFAQSFSLKAGFTQSDVIASPEPGNLFKPAQGFHAGIVINDIKLSDKIGLQPEFLYSRQGFKVGGVGSIGLHYLQAPVLVKLQVHEKAALLVGPQVSYLANARIGVLNDLFSVSYDNAFQKVDVSGIAGVELKVADGVAVGGRYQLGLNNINKDFSITNNLNFSDVFQLRNSGFQVYLSYGF
ncbi:MAG: porin family protein [Spirosomataceae bacterium]